MITVDLRRAVSWSTEERGGGELTLKLRLGLKVVGVGRDEERGWVPVDPSQ